MISGPMVSRHRCQNYSLTMISGPAVHTCMHGAGGALSEEGAGGLVADEGGVRPREPRELREERQHEEHERRDPEQQHQHAAPNGVHAPSHAVRTRHLHTAMAEAPVHRTIVPQYIENFRIVLSIFNVSAPTI